MNGAYLTAIASALAFALGAGSGYKLTADHFIVKEANAQKAAAEAYQARTEELNAVSAQLEKAKNERKVIYRTITQQAEKVVTRDVYRNVCLDGDGLSVVNAALAGKPIDPGQLDAALPATDSTGGNDGR